MRSHAVVAREKGIEAKDYRDVIRALKKDQFDAGPDSRPLPRRASRRLKILFRREKLVTLPNRPPRMRLASPAESAQQPAPIMQSAEAYRQHWRDRRVRAASDQPQRGQRENGRLHLCGGIMDTVVHEATART